MAQSTFHRIPIIGATGTRKPPPQIATAKAAAARIARAMTNLFIDKQGNQP